MSRPLTLLLAVLSALGALLVALPDASAQGRIVARHGDWQIRCERPVGAPAEQCALVQNVEAQDRANVGLTVIFLTTADGQARILRVLAPLGVLLPSGLGLSIDGNEVGLAGFARCIPEGCVAEVELDDGLMERFEAGQTATFVIFQTPEEGIGIPISLNGFAPGFAALDNPPPPPSAVDEAVSEPRAPLETDTELVEAAGEFEPGRLAFDAAAEVDDRTPFDQLLEDELFPFVAGAAAALVLLVLVTVVLLVRGGRRRKRRRAEARQTPPAVGADASEVDGFAEAEDDGPPPVGDRVPPRLAPPAAPRQLPATAGRLDAPRPPAPRPARAPSAPRPPRS